jgi:LacI family transcriptional regulator, galactose operon repressor
MSEQSSAKKKTRAKATPTATIADVARVAGVATMTVSRVLTGAAAVRPDKVERVQKAIRMLRYRPNEMARALRNKRSTIIGLIVPRLSDSFFATIAHAVNEVAVRNGYSVLITTSNDDVNTENSQIQMMVLRGVEGILIIPVPGYHARLNREEFEHVSVVALDRPMDDPKIDSVCVQNVEGSRQAVEHLIKHGHKRIVCISESNDLYTLRERYEGYRRAMIDHDLKTRSVVDFTSDSAEELIRRLMKGKAAPTAIFTTNGPATRHAIRALIDLNVRLPDEMALAGFDDFESADMLQTTVTVVRQPVEEMGKIAAMHLVEQLTAGADHHIGQAIALPVELVIRRSCGCKTTRAVPVQIR